jgi:insecticidal toxin complex protein TccC
MTTTVHWRTPNVTAIDSRGLAIRQIAYLRKVNDGPMETLITRQRHDAAGRLLEQWDPRLFGIVPNLTAVHRLSGEPLKVDSVDAGWRLSLPGLAGEVLVRWDQRGSHWRSIYDNQLRIIAVEESGQPNVETFTYADAAADAGHNLRGHLIKQVDPSGSLELSSFSLQGSPLSETRTIADVGTFLTRWIYSPLGAVLTQTDAGNHQQQLFYDIAGQLKKSRLLLKPGEDWKPILEDARYNAANQIIEQRAGNGVVSEWTYDTADGRLDILKAGLPSEEPLQHLQYAYDRVGNALRIDDLTFKPVYFKNQLIDGHRDFTYDSLYQLTSATGHDAAPISDLPGRPLPSDPKNHLNYKQRYEYDTGGNLIELVHERDVGGYTHETCIDPTSNRGVRWKPGDPAPDFAKLFDRHGNLQTLQAGRPLSWNSRDQLISATLVKRDSGLNDEERFRYSQGDRVYKRHETHTTTTTHFHQVIYLPGLEIRTRENGEELHVITLPGGRGSVRCLHWVSRKPSGIEEDQLRYSLDDHLGSSLMELDQNASLISHEGYYPFGGTAWLTAESDVQVSYKTIRYSGKEMDECGLYYYGARYYAPLYRWVSADPAGDVDGLNLYGFAGNNPLRYVDPQGGAKAESVITLYAGFISILGGYTAQARDQLHGVTHQKNIKRNLLANTVNVVAFGILGYEAGNIGGEQVGQLIADAPHATSVGGTSRLPYVEAATGGNLGGDIAGSMTDAVTELGGALKGKAQRLGGRVATLTEYIGRVGPLIPQTSKMSVAAIDSALGIPDAANEIQPNWNSIKDELIHPALDSILNPDFAVGRALGAWISILPGALNLFQRAVEAEDIKNRLAPDKIAKIEGMLADWESATLQRSAWMEAAFDALGTNAVHLDNGPNGARAPITRAGLQQATTETLHSIRHLQGAMAAYKEAGTTDNQFLANQRNAVARKVSRR